MKKILMVFLIVNFCLFEEEKKKKKPKRLHCNYDLMRSYGLAVGKF